jgi:hypothetical protein
MEELIKIQAELHAPKNQRNNFGKYNYRSCEDILEAVKPLLKKHGCTLTITDSIKEVGGIAFVEASAVILKGSESLEVTAQAGIDINRKGMDVAQSFGSSSSYARKYALNGLFLIDDSKQEAVQDPDSLEERSPVLPNLNEGSEDYKRVIKALTNKKATIEQVETKFTLSKEIKDKLLAL